MSFPKFLFACVLATPLALFADTAATPPANTPNPPAANEKSAATPAAKAPKPDPKTASDEEQQNRILTNIQQGQTYQGVHIPNFSPNGKLLMLFDAESAKRISDKNIEMYNLKIEIHNADGSTFHVEMKHALFDLDTHTLNSDTPTTIKRDDFVINGDRAEFHTKERFGKVFGNVKMIINSANTK